MNLPHDLLPAPVPATTEYPADYFYENVAKHLIVDVVRIMNNGLHIDLDKVADLEVVLNDQLADVEERLKANLYVNKYLTQRQASLKTKYVAERKTKLKPIEHFIKEFKSGDMLHRSYFMYLYATKQNISQPTDLLPTGIPKWPAKLIKAISASKPLLRKLLDKQIAPTHPIAVEAMELLALHKQTMYNEKYLAQINQPDIPVPTFNAGSAQQKQELFTMLGIESESFSKTTGNPSFSKAEIERINKETIDPNVVDLTEALIDHSTAAIIRNNFIEAFYNFSYESRLYGSLKLFGAKSFRPTSQKPNMLNFPSTNSVFAKPTKKCFTAPEGFVVATIDYSALEDRVIANLSKDKNKCDLFLQHLDGHCLNAYGYFKDEVGQYMDLTDDTITDVKQFFELTHTVPELKDIRQKGKPATFGLSYGAYPDKVSKTLKVPLNEAQAIFDNYHNTLYPGITDYRENYVLTTAKEQGYIHLGLGCTINTDDADRDIRTINNATAQFWSILTLLTINKMHHLIDEAGYTDDIIVTATIYDSIYFEVRKDPAIIQWLNETIVPIMETDFMEGQIVHNEARLELGPSWASLTELSLHADINEIEGLLNEL